MNYEKENAILIENILNTRFFDRMKDDKNDISIELIVSPECNLKCEYCYLQKNKDKIYPKNIRNKENILKNLRIFFDYLINNDLKANEMDLFSGEIWQTDFGVDVLNVIYEYIKKKKLINKLTIPTNASFLMDDYYLGKMQSFIDGFNKNGVDLHLSFSLDGYILEDNTRPFVDRNFNGFRDELFYEKAFKFAKKNGVGFHPMISSYSIDKWIDNYMWWVSMYEKYDMAIEKLMMLEVRDNDWTKDKINKFIEFINYVVEYKHNYVYTNIKDEIFESFGIAAKTNYNNTSIWYVKNGYTCSIQHSLCIRLGDMAIVPCHRTAYDKFITGYLDISDGRNFHIIPKNVEIGIQIMSGNPKMIQYKCSYCKYRDFCLKGCLGSQYESNKEIFYPCSTVCELEISKINFLIKKYDEMGFFDILKEMLYNGEIPALRIKDVKRIMEFRENIIKGDVSNE